MDYPVLIATQLSHYIRSLRRELGLSQAGLGALIGVGQTRVADIEKHPGLISVNQLLAVLAALQTQLVMRVERPPETATPRRRTSITTAAQTSRVRPSTPRRKTPTPPRGVW